MHEIEIKLLKSRMIQTTAVEMQADPQLPTRRESEWMETSW
jgi:hypothetical protein